MRFKIADAIVYGASELQSERPRLESEILLASLLRVERVYLHAHMQHLLSVDQTREFLDQIARARSGEPIEYITQKVGFYGYEWKIRQGVLIPRPETEILIEKTCEVVAKQKIQKVLELGVGSGVISIVLALLCSDIEIVAVDINPLAILLAQDNLERFSTIDPSLKERIALKEIDLFQDSSLLEVERFDLLVSNPPYIANSYRLPKNVSFEPKEALFGGERGDEILLKLINLCESYGIRTLSCEMGHDQKKVMQDALYSVFATVAFYQDWSGLDRGFVASRF